MKKILILGSNGDLAKAVYRNINKTNNKIYKLKKKDINFLKQNSQKKLFLILKKIKPDVIINCIGYFDTNKGDFDRIVRSNLLPVWLLIKYFLLNKKSKVKVISIGSSSYNQPRKKYILYAATKTALNNIHSSATELFDGSMINFYIINPPAIKSKMRLKVMKLLKQKVDNKLAEDPEKIANQIIKKVKI